MGYKPIFTLQDETFLFKERVGNINKNRKVTKESNIKIPSITPPKNATHSKRTYAEVVKSEALSIKRGKKSSEK